MGMENYNPNKALLVFGGLLIGLLVGLPATAFAKINGECSDCHTMHNSKAGAPMAQLSDGSGPSLSPFPVLLISDCIGCHASGGAEAVADFNGSQVPQVYHTDTTDLAGGNFAYIDGTKGAGASDRKGHNVVDILSADATLDKPPGWRHNLDSPYSGNKYFWLPPVIQCAGLKGCHGVRNQNISDAYEDPETFEIVDAVPREGLSAMTGAHHYNVDGKIDGSTGAEATDVANSFRFLTGLYGLENTDPAHPWEDYDSASHNEYFGVNNVNFGGVCTHCHVSGAAPSTHSSMTTPNHSMSGFCGTCHSTFHSTAAEGKTAWLRHPADYVIQDKTEYAAYTTYDITAPVARPVVPDTPSSDVFPGTDLVMCLSCHVAHGSDFEGMLRFDYTEMIAGGGSNTTGCFVCHTTKDTGTMD
jgi:predicted CXXCH cytochrome family protein